MTTKEAINFFGNRKNLAAKLQIWPHPIYRWGEYPPMARQYQLQVLTKGALKVTPPV